MYKPFSFGNQKDRSLGFLNSGFNLPFQLDGVKWYMLCVKRKLGKLFHFKISFQTYLSNI